VDRMVVSFYKYGPVADAKGKNEAHLDPSGKPGLRKEPVHAWASHAADAFRTAAVMIREPERKKEQEKRRPASRLSPWS
jgi:hypothetical protein